MNGYRYFTTEQLNDATIARAVDAYLQGTALAELVKFELAQIAASSPARTLIIDFSNVKMISSSVVSSLLSVKSQLTASDKRLRLCSMSESLRYVFKTLNMDGTVFEILDSVDQALSDDRSRLHWYSDVGDRVSPPEEESA